MITKIFRHVVIEKDGVQIVGLIPEDFAVLDNEVEVKNEKGRYESGWLIQQVGEQVWGNILTARDSAPPRKPRRKRATEVSADVGIMEVTIEAGEDEYLGTEDDEVKISKKPDSECKEDKKDSKDDKKDKKKKKKSKSKKKRGEK